MSGVFDQPFFFMRHGVTDHNLARVIMGQRDVPLNESGRSQARDAADMLSCERIAAIAVSPLSRATETAEIVAGRLSVPIQVIDGLKERAWGVLEGRNNRERLSFGGTPHGAEAMDDFLLRTVTAMRAITGPAPILVVAHSGTCRALRRHLAVSDGEGPVPNAVPLRYEPHEFGWREVRLRRR